MTTNEPAISLNDPIWTIEHVAWTFHVAVDTAREYTYRQDFPASHVLGSRLLWDREDVLRWFRALPTKTGNGGARKAASPAQSAALKRGTHEYNPRGRKAVAA